MFSTMEVLIIAFFLVSSYAGHQLLHRVIKTPAQYYRPEESVKKWETWQDCGHVWKGELNVEERAWLIESGRKMEMGMEDWGCGGVIVMWWSGWTSELI
jgi:hypothetical protein